jgi:hypothetical protein
MRKAVILSVALIGTFAAAQSDKTMPRMKSQGAAKAQCAQGAICFSGEAREGEEFRRDLSADLDFVLGLPGGFDVVLKEPDTATCKLSAWVANPPLMAHHDTEIDAAYDWTAEQEVQTSPREFRFVTNCADYSRLSELSQTDPEKYLANLTLLAKGEGRIWITDARVTHSHGINGKEQGAVEWIKFSVEIRLPNPH